MLALDIYTIAKEHKDTLKVFTKIAFEKDILDDLNLIVKTNMRSGDIADVLNFNVGKSIKNIQK